MCLGLKSQILFIFHAVITSIDFLCVSSYSREILCSKEEEFEEKFSSFSLPSRPLLFLNICCKKCREMAKVNSNKINWVSLEYV